MSVFFTGRGDLGETDTMGMSRISKDSATARAIGDIDELNSALGVAIANLEDMHIAEMLKVVQDRLFAIGAEIMSSEKMLTKLRGRVGCKDVEELEKHIDGFAAELPETKKFVLPGGSTSASYLHLARSVARRTERSMVALSKERKISPHILAYLNRLSSFLFVAALVMNRKEGIEEQNPVY
jgi:cob(I)alamin adenosyltransferase